jgi:hypothetical protein
MGSTNTYFSGTPCQLRRSTQHLLGVYWPESGSLRFFLGVDSSGARLGRAALSDGGQVRSTREVLLQEQIGVFVCSTLPGTLWIAEVDLHICGYRKLLVLRHLQSTIPCKRASQRGWKFTNMPTQGLLLRSLARVRVSLQRSFWRTN